MMSAYVMCENCQGGGTDPDGIWCRETGSDECRECWGSGQMNSDFDDDDFDIYEDGGELSE